MLRTSNQNSRTAIVASIRFSSALSLLLAGTMLAGCARFRIDELAPAPVYSIPLQMELESETFPEGMPVVKKERIYGNFPYMPAVNDDGIFLTDVAFRVVRFFTGNQQEPTWILNASGQPLKTEIDTTALPAGIPGAVVAGEDSFYVELHGQPEEERKVYTPIDSNPDLPAENRLPGILRPEFSTATPARIARVNLEDRTVEILKNADGQDARFLRIRRMVMGDKDTVYVLHRDGDGPVATIYRDGVLDRTVKPQGIEPPEELKKHRLEIETLLPYPGGQEFLVSAVFRNPSTFTPEERRIYRQPVNGTAQEIYATDNAEDSLSWPGPDQGFILETLDDSGGILFKIFSAQGEYLNNQLLRFPGVRESWRETYRTLNNRIFSVRIQEGNYQLNEWR